MDYNLRKYVPRPPSLVDKKLKRQFTILDHFLRDNTHFENAYKSVISTVEIPLLKQFLLDLFFLTYFWDPENVKADEDTPIYIAVAGAGVGTHYPLLADMFPMFQFHLYNVDGFDIEATDNIILHNYDFGKSKWNDTEFYLISHLKSGNNENDMKKQMEWLERYRPIKSMIRFDVNYLNYYDGYALIPPWDSHSYELYLIPTNNLDRRQWNLKLLRKQLWYHYNVVREHHNYLNVFTNDWNVYNKWELINTRWDDTWTITILRDYLDKMTGNYDLHQVNHLLMLCCEELDLKIGKYKTK